jgi:uncharacterized membrane protein
MFPHGRFASAFAAAALAAAGAALTSGIAVAQTPVAATATQAGEDRQGLWLTTPFPELTAEAGSEITMTLRLANVGLPPQRVSFDVSGLPQGWSWEIDGGGQAVGAAIAGPDETVELTLEVTPPADADVGQYDFTVTGEADGQSLRLPIALRLTEAEPARLTLEPTLPALRGSVRSTFDFQVAITNEGRDDTVVNLLAQAPAGFEVTFKQRYGSQELTSLPVAAGKTENITVSVSPAENTPAGQYPVLIRAASESATGDAQLLMDVTGRPTLSLSGPEGRLSGEAVAGEQRSFTFTLANTGTAAARSVSMSASPPSGWTVTFEPDEIDELQPGQRVEVSVGITPSDKAIAGDYVVPVRANGDGVSDNASFRVTVTTSTVWGIVGLGVIAAAVVVLAVAVTRYGRR